MTKIGRCILGFLHAWLVLMRSNLSLAAVSFLGLLLLAVARYDAGPIHETVGLVFVLSGVVFIASMLASTVFYGGGVLLFSPRIRNAYQIAKDFKSIKRINEVVLRGITSFMK